MIRNLRQVVASNLDELIAALQELKETANVANKIDNNTATTVVNIFTYEQSEVKLRLYRERLTDGSYVYNVEVS